MLKRMEEIEFKDTHHRQFFLHHTSSLIKNGNLSPYNASLLYLLGLCDTTRRHMQDIYDPSIDEIGDCLFSQAWHTSKTIRITALALNLFNAYTVDTHLQLFTVDSIFCGSSNIEYFFEAVRIPYC